MAQLKLARWYSQTLRRGEGVEALVDWVGREKRMELWSKEETGGRIPHERGSSWDERKTRSIVDEVLQWEKWVGTLTICLRSKESDTASTLSLENDVYI